MGCFGGKSAKNIIVNNIKLSSEIVSKLFGVTRPLLKAMVPPGIHLPGLSQVVQRTVDLVGSNFETELTKLLKRGLVSSTSE